MYIYIYIYIYCGLNNEITTVTKKEDKQKEYTKKRRTYIFYRNTVNLRISLRNCRDEFWMGVNRGGVIQKFIISSKFDMKDDRIFFINYYK